MRMQTSQSIKAISLFFIITILALAGCRLLDSSIQGKQFAEQYPYEDLNHTLILHPTEEITNTSFNQTITILMENRGDMAIAIWPKSDIIGLAYDIEDKRWVEVRNAVEYPDTGLLLGAPGDNVPSSTAIYFWPDLISPIDSMDIRILVVGHIWDEEQGSGEPVAAFIDLTLEK